LTILQEDQQVLADRLRIETGGVGFSGGAATGWSTPVSARF
jgi:hypothetical protein